MYIEILIYMQISESVKLHVNIWYMSLITLLTIQMKLNWLETNSNETVLILK